MSNGSPDIIIAVFLVAILAYIGFVVYVKRRQMKKYEENEKTKTEKLNKVIEGRRMLRSGEAEHTKRRLSRYEIQRRVKEGRRNTRNIKISQKHFPNSPAFEKRQWDREKKPEEER